MRRLIAISCLAIASCERSDSLDPDCPPEATVETDQLGSGDNTRMRKRCSWADRETMIETDPRGTIVSRTSYRGGKPDGLWIVTDPSRGTRMEASYQRDVPHGRWRTFQGDELVFESFYIEGLLDGFSWSAHMGTQQFDRGKRTGLWSFGFQGKIGATRIYGNDILLGVDGRSVPLPPASIEVDSKIISRTSCAPTSLLTDRCHALFEDYQVCELEPAERTSCQERARSNYRQGRGH